VVRGKNSFIRLSWEIQEADEKKLGVRNYTIDCDAAAYLLSSAP